MARKIIWSVRAQEDRKAIFSYWNKHNRSNTYSKRLNRLFKESINLLKEHPFIGRKTDVDNVHIKTVSHFLIFYEIKDHALEILTIWDGRRNPDDMP
jgi:toxin YoeB